MSKAAQHGSNTNWREATLFLALGAALAVYYFCPIAWLALIAALAFLALACLRLDLALIYVIFSVPFYLLPKQFTTAELGLSQFIIRDIPLRFSLAEFTVLACAVAFLLRTFLTRRGGLAISICHWYENRARTLQDLSLNPSLEGGGKSPLPFQGRGRGLGRGDSGTWQGLASKLQNWKTSLLPPALLLLAATLSLLASQELRPALREYRTVILEPLLFYFLLLSVTDSQERARRFALAFVALGMGVSLFSLFHYFFVGEVEATGGVERMLAIYHSPNALALFLGRVAPLAITLALLGAAGKERWLHILTSAAVLLALYFTYSRGAWGAVAVALLFILLMPGRRWLLAGAATVGAGLLALLALLPLERLISSETSLQRLRLWQAALDMIRDHPVLGVGLDNFLYQYPRYMQEEAWAEPNLSHPHNILLDFWTRTGILGVASLVWLQVAFWRAALGLYRHLPEGIDRALVLGLMASMVDFLVHGLIDNSFFLIDLAFVFWLTYGLVMAMERNSIRQILR